MRRVFNDRFSLTEKADVVGFAAVAENVRVRVRRDGELPLPDELSDLCPRPSLVVKEADPPVSQIVRGEDRDPCGSAGASDRGPETIRSGSGE
jgi:hypothetical protein